MSADIDRRDYQFGVVGAAVAITSWGAAGVLVKSIDMSAAAIAVYRFSAYVILLGSWMWIRSVRPSWALLRASFPGGVCLALDVILFFTAIKLTTVVNATIIGSLQPLVVMGFAVVLFHERVRPRELIAAVLALVGVVVIVLGSSGSTSWQPRGDLAAVGALFTWSGYFIFSKRSKGVLTSAEYSLGTAFWTAVLTLGIGATVGQDLSPPAVTDLIPLAALTVGAGLLGHSLMNWSLVRIPLWLGSTLTLLIPVVSSLLAWIFLDESLTSIQMTAMVGVVAVLAYIVASQSQSTPTPARTVPSEPAGVPY